MSPSLTDKCTSHNCTHAKFSNPLVYMHCSDLMCANFLDKCPVHKQSAR